MIVIPTIVILTIVILTIALLMSVILTIAILMSVFMSVFMTSLLFDLTLNSSIYNQCCGIIVNVCIMMTVWCYVKYAVNGWIKLKRQWLNTNLMTQLLSNVRGGIGIKLNPRVKTISL